MMGEGTVLWSLAGKPRGLSSRRVPEGFRVHTSLESLSTGVASESCSPFSICPSTAPQKYLKFFKPTLPGLFRDLKDGQIQTRGGR